MTEQTEAPKPDLLYGITAIAEHLGISERQAYHLHEVKNIPTFKIGYRVCARRTRLDAWLTQAAQGGNQ